MKKNKILGVENKVVKLSILTKNWNYVIYQTYWKQ